VYSLRLNYILVKENKKGQINRAFHSLAQPAGMHYGLSINEIHTSPGVRDKMEVPIKKLGFDYIERPIFRL